MIGSITRGLLVAALCVALGLHWALLQSVAWTTMVVKYSRENSLAAAIEKTFDGAHPCGLCHAVQKGKSSEKKSELPSVSRKFDLIAADLVGRAAQPFQELRYVLTSASACARALSPPVPPPR